MYIYISSIYLCNMPIYLHVSTSLSTYLPTCLPIYLSIYISRCIFVDPWSLCGSFEPFRVDLELCRTARWGGSTDANVARGPSTSLASVRVRPKADSLTSEILKKASRKQLRLEAIAATVSDHEHEIGHTAFFLLQLSKQLLGFSQSR